MRRESVEKIILITPILLQWRDRSKPAGLLDFLWIDSPEWRYSVAITEALETRDYTRAQLAEELQLNKNTVRQVLRALEEGGYPVKREIIQSKRPGGREEMLSSELRKKAGATNRKVSHESTV